MCQRKNCSPALRVTLIVDAAPLVARGDSRDPLHAQVGDVLQAEHGELVVQLN
jgi:hypothetical protein